MERTTARQDKDVRIGREQMEKWRSVLNLITSMFCFSTAIITRAFPNEMVVLVSNSEKSSEFSEGQLFKRGSCLYCEAVMDSGREVMIQNALHEPRWKDSSAAAAGNIAYLGFPVFWPDGDIFGTICVIDNKEHVFNEYETGFLRLTAIILADSLKALLDRRQLNREVDQQRQTATALRESEERFRKIFELSPNAVMITAASDGRFLDANEACLKLFGVEKEDIIGRCVTDFPMYGDETERSVVLEKLERNLKIRDHISFKKNKQGDLLELNVSVDRINIGDEMCLIATLNDLTDQKRLERKLMAANERLTLATDAAGIGVWDWDVLDNTLEIDNNMVCLYQYNDGKKSVFRHGVTACIRMILNAANRNCMRRSKTGLPIGHSIVSDCLAEKCAILRLTDK